MPACHRNAPFATMGMMRTCHTGTCTSAAARAPPRPPRPPERMSLSVQISHAPHSRPANTPARVLYERANDVVLENPAEALMLLDRCSEILAMAERSLRPPWAYMEDPAANPNGSLHALALRPEIGHIEADRAATLNRLHRPSDAIEASTRAIVIAGGDLQAPWRAFAARAGASLLLGDTTEAHRCLTLGLRAAQRERERDGSATDGRPRSLADGESADGMDGVVFMREAMHRLLVQTSARRSGWRRLRELAGGLSWSSTDRPLMMAGAWVLIALGLLAALYRVYLLRATILCRLADHEMMEEPTGVAQPVHPNSEMDGRGFQHRAGHLPGYEPRVEALVAGTAARTTSHPTRAPPLVSSNSPNGAPAGGRALEYHPWGLWEGVVAMPVPEHEPEPDTGRGVMGGRQRQKQLANTAITANARQVEGNRGHDRQ